eukprot:6479076-Amphidinium_carterae.1
MSIAMCLFPTDKGYNFLLFIHLHPGRIKQIRLAGVLGCRIPNRCIALAKLDASIVADGIAVSWKAGTPPYLTGGFNAHEMDMFFLNASRPLAFTPNRMRRPETLNELARVVLADGEPICQPLSEAREGQSHFDLLRSLASNGWLWKRAGGKALIKIDPYVRGGTKIMYSAGVQLSCMYMRCLLSCEEDGHPIKVPHSQQDSVYAALLGGEDWEHMRTGLLASLRPKKRALQKPLLLQRDGASENEEAEPGASMQAAPVEAAGAEESLSLEECMERAMDEYGDFDARSSESEVDNGATTALSAAQRKARVPIPKDIASLACKWGIFTISVKRATVKEPLGSLEA